VKNNVCGLIKSISISHEKQCVWLAIVKYFAFYEAYSSELWLYYLTLKVFLVTPFGSSWS